MLPSNSYAFQSKQEQLKLLVVAVSGPSLLGHDWRKRISMCTSLASVVDSRSLFW